MEQGAEWVWELDESSWRATMKFPFTPGLRSTQGREIAIGNYDGAKRGQFAKKKNPPTVDSGGFFTM